MGTVSADLQQAQREAASGILEYVNGIQTLRAFNLAGQHFQSLKKSFDQERKAAIGMETGAGRAGEHAGPGHFELRDRAGYSGGCCTADPRGVDTLLLHCLPDPYADGL